LSAVRRPIDLQAKYVAQCKICKLGKSDPDFLKYLYQLRFDIELPLAKVATLANEMLRDISSTTGRKMPELNEQNLSTHFSDHVPVELARKYKMQVAMGTAAVTAQVRNASEISVARIEQAEKGLDDEINIFRHLLDIYTRMRERYDKLPRNAEVPLSPEEIELGDQMTKILGQLGRMKQSEKMISVMVHALMSKFAEGVMLVCLTELEATKLELSTFVDDAAARDRIVEGLRIRLGRGFMAASDATLRDIKSRFAFAALQ